MVGIVCCPQCSAAVAKELRGVLGRGVVRVTAGTVFEFLLE